MRALLTLSLTNRPAPHPHLASPFPTLTSPPPFSHPQEGTASQLQPCAWAIETAPSETTRIKIQF